MASHYPKIEENVPGRYYVNQGCIGCTLCSEIAPDNFGANILEGYDYVRKQPDGKDEENQCIEAMATCPMSAIGDDG